MGAIAATNDIIADIFIYLIETDQVMTQNGLYDAEVFFDTVYRYEDPFKLNLSGICPGFVR